MSYRDAICTIIAISEQPAVDQAGYRMLGSLAEAEDVAQDAWLRWSKAGRDDVHKPVAFLTRTVTRLCLERMRPSRSRRESYVGSWLPQPLIEFAGPADDEPEDVTLTLMMALERLSPLERAAFLLHDVFDLAFEEVAKAIERDPAACRQLASRARDRMQPDKLMNVERMMDRPSESRPPLTRTAEFEEARGELARLQIGVEVRVRIG